MVNRMRVISVMIVCTCIQNITLQAQLRLPRLVRDSMILQRDTPASIWGWANANEKVTVRFNNKTYKTKTAPDGTWQLQLPPTKAGGPYTIDIAAGNKITIKDILFGDVWFCSGQSNMVHQMELHSVSLAKDIANANYPGIRQFWIPTLTSLQGPQSDIPTGYWKPALPTDVQKFSVVAYFFARDLYEQYHIPIGIINSSVGGPPAEAWISEDGLKNFADITKSIQQNKDTGYVNQANRIAAAVPKRYSTPDRGMTGDKKWFDINYIPQGWRKINVPGYWEDQGLRDLDGVVWYRKEAELPAAMESKAARIFLGRITDADELYINGRLVGNTTYQYPQRRYNIPAGLLKAGKNIFVVRVTNNAGKGGFVPDKPYYIFAGTDTIDLKGTWQYKVGSVTEPSKRDNFAAGITEQNQPAALYNAMVAPVIPYTIKGALWYQGESNTGRAADYTNILTALIEDWRIQFKQSQLPFLFVQLPGFGDYNYLPAQSQWAQLRDAQLQTLKVPNTAMAVAIDLGEWNDLHPDNKKEVGLRLALAARKMVYKENIVSSGPLYQSAIRDGHKMIIRFSDTGTGLITNDGEEPGELAIAGADKKFVWARAKIENDKLVVWSDAITEPVYVRYGWADNPVHANLYNKEGLPASPFKIE